MGHRLLSNMSLKQGIQFHYFSILNRIGGGGGLGYFFGGYVPPGTPNWHPVLKKKSPKIDTPF